MKKKTALHHSRAVSVPPLRLERRSSPPEGDTLSTELWGLEDYSIIRGLGGQVDY
jgi:hypothetical protein